MGRQDIQAVYCLNDAEYTAFQQYFAGNSVTQISASLNMTTSQAGKVLDSARQNVWGGMTEKRVNRGEVSVNPSLEHNGNTKENTEAGSSPGEHNMQRMRTPVARSRKRPND